MTEHTLKTKFIIGNWKMHMTLADTRRFVGELSLMPFPKGLQVGLAVPFTMIAVAAETARSSQILIGAQNCATHVSGPFTGEVSAAMVKDAGATFVLVGHSERRRLFYEDDATVNQKIKQALESSLKPLLCIGETEAEMGQTASVLRRQLLGSLKDLNPKEIERTLIAYEPVWAIGTGKSATKEQVESAHAHSRAVIQEMWGEETASLVPILYGGSVNENNCKMLMELSGVDGLLVGGASLSFESFNKMITL